MPKARNSKTSAERDQEFLSRLGRIIVPQFILQLIRDGIIIPNGKTDEQIKAEAATIFRKYGTEITIGIDHTKTLLAKARAHVRQKETEFASLYFATFFEHKINWIIVQICQKRKIRGSEIKQILREAGLRAKCTWIMALLNYEPLSSRAVKTVNDIAEIRNSFVHYKWPSEDPDSSGLQQSKDRHLSILKGAEYVVAHLKRIEERHLYKGHGKRVRGMISTRKKGP